MGQRLIISEQEKKHIRSLYEQTLSSPDDKEEFIKFLKTPGLKFQVVASPNPYSDGDLKVELRANQEIPVEFLDLIKGVAESITAFSSDGRKIAQIVGSGTGDSSQEGLGSEGSLDETVNTKNGFYRIIKSSTPFIENIKRYANGKENRIYISINPRKSTNLKFPVFYRPNPSILLVQ